MRFWCVTDCILQGVPNLVVKDGVTIVELDANSRPIIKTDKNGIPVRHGYKSQVHGRFEPYDIDEHMLKCLTATGLFPECFEFADDAARNYVESHNDELCDIVDNRVLPYRKLTPEEERNDLDIQRGRKEGEYTLPHGTIEANAPRLVRRGKTLVERTTGETLAEGDKSPIQLQRKGKAAEKPATGRKPMSEEARKAAGERLAKARAAKAAARQTVKV